jgi:hypothetical protein
MRMYKRIFKEKSRLTEGDYFPDDIYDDLSDGSQAYFEKGKTDKDMEFLVNFFSQPKAVAPTLKAIDKLLSGLRGGPYTKGLIEFLQDVLENGPSLSKDAGFKRFDKGQVYYLKSVFSSLARAVFYFYDDYDEDGNKKHLRNLATQYMS